MSSTFPDRGRRAADPIIVAATVAAVPARRQRVDEWKLDAVCSKAVGVSSQTEAKQMV